MKPVALIVEDDTELNEIFALALEEAGYVSQIVTDGEKALAQLKELTPALIILDLHLPFVSGEAVFEYVKADSRFDSAWVVLATADSHRAQQLQDQVDWVLLKPISFTQLRNLTQRLLTRTKNNE